MTDEEKQVWSEIVRHAMGVPNPWRGNTAIIAADSELTALRSENERLRKAIEWVLTLGIADFELDTWRTELRKREAREE